MDPKYDFGPDFEKALVRLCLTDPTFVPQNVEVVSPSFLVDERAAVLVDAIGEFYRNYKVAPTVPSLLLFMGDKEDNTDAKAYLREAMGGETRDLAFIRDRAKDFARNRAVEEAILESSKLLSSGDFSSIRERMVKALNVGAKEKGEAYDYFGETIARFKSYAPGAPTSVSGSIRTVPTGISTLDALLDGGGLGVGELGLIQAPANHGKTALLINIGYGALILGLKVVHFTLEVSSVKVARRYDMRVTGLTKKDLFTKKKTGASQILKLAGDMKCGLIIKQFPTKTARAQDLDAFMRSQAEERGFRPDLIVCDYGEIMAPERKRDDRWIEIEESYEALRALAEEWKAPLWTGSQTNISALNVKTSDMRHTGGSFGKMKVADVVITINLEPKASDILPVRLHVAKNREEESGGEASAIFKRSTQTVTAGE